MPHKHHTDSPFWWIRVRLPGLGRTRPLNTKVRNKRTAQTMERVLLAMAENSWKDAFIERLRCGGFEPITQTILHDPPKQNGNCFPACLAMIVGWKIDDIPPFQNIPQDSFGTWWFALQGWAAHYELSIRDQKDDPGFLCIASGDGGRGAGHAVMWYDGKMAFDPHPSRAGLVGVPESFRVITPNGREG